MVGCTALFEKIGVEGPPETVVDPARRHILIEFPLGAAFQGLAPLERGMSFRGQRRQYALAIWKKQCVAHVKENETALRHESIIRKLRKSGAPDPEVGTRVLRYRD